LIFSREIYFVAVGYLVIILSGLLINFNVLEKTLTPNSLIEIAWVLGLLLMAFGFNNILRNISAPE
jgi:hypothetical protein